MYEELFTREDFKQIENKNIPIEKIYKQIESFRKGILPIRLNRPCTIGDGIEVIQRKDMNKLINVHNETASKYSIIKFIPASGAATRMFKHLLSLLNSPNPITREWLLRQVEENDSSAEFAIKILVELKRFAFYEALKDKLVADGYDIETLCDRGEYELILEYLLTRKGLDYANHPKGLIAFHSYRNCVRTACEEHLAEAIDYCVDSDGNARIHFTIAEEHFQLFQKHIHDVCQLYEQNVAKLQITFSTQKSSTDTIAVDLENNPLRDRNDRLVFRPGGHGALLENLNELQEDIIYMKNIDNVVPDCLKEDTSLYKKVTCGLLVKLQRRIFNYLISLEKTAIDEKLTQEIISFITKKLSTTLPNNLRDYSLNDKRDFLFDKMNRPLRVCGVVRNVGEPGGGPFWVEETDSSLSLQIVEYSQVNHDEEKQHSIWNSATHFNPVDIVCSIKDFRGQTFDLRKYVNPNTGFISYKSKDGGNLKALELPGLWNGSMANWNTVFVEVPSTTFNPVKTVNDLLRPQHLTD